MASLVLLLVSGCSRSGPAGRPDGPVRIHVLFVPGADAENAEASFRATFGDAQVRALRGRHTASVEDDEHTVAWRGPVDEPVELVMEPDRLDGRVLVTVERAGSAPVQERIQLGRHALVRTWAVPVYEPVEGAPAAAPELTLVYDERAALVDVAVQPRTPAKARVEFLFAEPAPDKRLTLVPVEGFGEPMSFDGRSWVEADQADYARVAARRRGEDRDVLVATHLDGRWPDALRVTVDGRPAARDVCRFVLPAPFDGRVGAALVEAPDRTNLAPGSIVIWVGSGWDAVETDSGLYDAVQDVRSVAIPGGVGGTNSTGERSR